MLHKNILTWLFNSKWFIIINCLSPNGVMSKVLLLHRNALHSFCGLSPLRNLFSYFHILHMYMYISTGSIRPRKSISLPPPPTIFFKCLFFSFENWKAFTNTKLGGKRSSLLKFHLKTVPPHCIEDTVVTYYCI